MRVLHVPTVDWQATEGIARACRELATELVGIESLLVVDRDPGPSGAPFAQRRVVAGWTPLTPWRREFRARIVRELRPDVVHLHGGELAPALAFAPALRGLPVVVTCYAANRLPSRRALARAGMREHRANASPVRAVAARSGMLARGRRALRSGRVAVLCTPDLGVERAYRDAGPVVRVQGGARVAAHQARWSDDPVVVFAGRAQTGRGIDDLIAAFPTLHARVPRARLRLLLLPGGAAARWQAELTGVPWADVRVGALAGLDGELATCQAGAFPFRWSATLTPALAAAEAMAAGLPVVATPVECLAPLVEPGVNGFLAPAHDPVALGDALARVLHGPETWQPLSEGARKTIDERWSWAAAADATRAAYELALGRAAARRR